MHSSGDITPSQQVYLIISKHRKYKSLLLEVLERRLSTEDSTMVQGTTRISTEKLLLDLAKEEDGGETMKEEEAEEEKTGDPEERWESPEGVGL